MNMLTKNLTMMCALGVFRFREQVEGSRARMKGDGTNITLTSNPMLSKNQRRCSYRPMHGPARSLQGRFRSQAL